MTRHNRRTLSDDEMERVLNDFWVMLTADYTLTNAATRQKYFNTTRETIIKMSV
jgi:hypothetical protein